MQPLMNVIGRLTVAVVLTLSPALAGADVVDSPLPAPFTKHVFTVPGVLNISGFHTYFACSNLDRVAVTIGVELFGGGGGGPGNDVVATALNVVPGGTVLFGTSGAPHLNISPDSRIGPLPANKAAARILSTSKKIACNAFVADSVNVPPTSGWQLTIIAKTNQKAAN